MYAKKWDPGLKIGETISKFFSHFSSRNVYGIQNNTQNKHHSLCLRFENKGIDWKPSNKNSIKILNEGQMQMKNLKFKAYNTTGISTTENTALSMKERNMA